VFSPPCLLADCPHCPGTLAASLHQKLSTIGPLVAASILSSFLQMNPPSHVSRFLEGLKRQYAALLLRAYSRTGRFLFSPRHLRRCWFRQFTSFLPRFFSARVSSTPGLDIRNKATSDSCGPLTLCPIPPFVEFPADPTVMPFKIRVTAYKSEKTQAVPLLNHYSCPGQTCLRFCFPLPHGRGQLCITASLPFP